MDGRWRIELLGRLRLRRGDGEIVPVPRLRAAPLLAYLAYHPQHPHPREVLIELLWPEEDPEEGRGKLRSLLHDLRALLSGTGGSAPGDRPPSTNAASTHFVGTRCPASGAPRLLIAERGTVCLDPAAFTADVAEFHAALQAAAGAADLAERVRLLETAVALYQGELLPGYYEPWVIAAQQREAESYLAALQQLAAAREKAGDLEGALAAARRAVSADPLREEAHYDLMRLYAAAGQPSATVRQYQELERLLKEELGETPSAATRALAEELRESARTVVVARSRVGRRPAAERAERRSDPPVIRSSGPPAAAPQSAAVPSRSPLPLQFTRFFGREEEIARLTELLCIPETRLVTLTGPGGSGKTRLAIAVAGRLQEQLQPGASPQLGGPWFVPLADLRDARQIPEAILGALGLAGPFPGEPLDQVVAALQEQPGLLVLDNFEQLVEGGALLLRALLVRVPTLTCLVTSRQRLNLAGEQEFAVLPLPTPGQGVRRRVKGVGAGEEGPVGPDTRHPTPYTLLQFPSVALFVDRAQAAWPEFRLTEANAGAVATLCDRLEGLPLAIELAAARAAVLSPQQMLSHLERRFDWLVSRQRDLPTRHRTLRAAIDASYQLLTPELRQFFARLSVFRGGWTLAAAEAVCGSEAPAPAGPAFSSLEQLRENSLVLVTECGTERRYRLLETLREYAAEQLTDGERAALARRHAAYYCFLAQEAQPERVGLAQGEWLERLEAEHDNFRAVLEWSGSAEGDPQLGLELGGALWWFWSLRGYLSEGRERLARLLALPAAAACTTARARAQACTGLLAIHQGDLGAARAPLEEGLTIARGLGDQRGVAFCVQHLGDLAFRQGDAPAARSLFEEALTLWQELGDSYGIAGTHQCLGAVAEHLGDYREAHRRYEACRRVYAELGDRPGVMGVLACVGRLALHTGELERARTLLEECLALFRDRDDRIGIATAHELLGRVAHRQGELARAEAHLRQSLQIWRELGSKSGTATTLSDLGHVTLDQGDHARAQAFYAESLGAWQAYGDRRGVASALVHLGRIALQQGVPGAARAACLLGAAQAVRDDCTAPAPPHERTDDESAIARARAILGEERFATAWGQGRAMTLDQVVTEALAEIRSDANG